ncbi:hypothetical protein CBM2598_P40007 [Cupriavidus taiwanensis]|nr:hypothetical protein CBM2598_P40007 [Cupriavidus taiwanensis]
MPFSSDFGGRVESHWKVSVKLAVALHAAPAVAWSGRFACVKVVVPTANETKSRREVAVLTHCLAV